MEYTRGPHVANQKESGVCCDSRRTFVSVHEEAVRPYAKVVEDLRQAARLAEYQECIDLLNSVDYFVILSDVFGQKLGLTFEEVEHLKNCEDCFQVWRIYVDSFVSW